VAAVVASTAVVVAVASTEVEEAEAVTAKPLHSQWQ
jgi:hypothetical protein